MQDILMPHRAKAPAGQVIAEADWGEAQPDEALAVLGLLAEGHAEGLRGALITIVKVIGGSARGLGAQMSVLEDGRFAGYVSGGCVEAAVAAEAMRVISNGRDEVLRLGAGSPLMDIRLPCGGGIDLHIHRDPDPAMVAEALVALRARKPFYLKLGVAAGTGRFEAAHGLLQGSGDDADGTFRKLYEPKSRLILIGRGLELEATARLAVAGAFEVHAFSADDDSAAVVAALDVPTFRLSTPDEEPRLDIDDWTAVIFLFHDHDWETRLMRQALAANPFFVGALGSVRTHDLRKARLAAAGIAEEDIARVQGPVGLFGPTRDAASLAFSILGQVTAVRLKTPAL